MFCFFFKVLKLGFETRFSYPRTCTFILPSKHKPTCGDGSALINNWISLFAPANAGQSPRAASRLPHPPLFSHSEPKGHLCVPALAPRPPVKCTHSIRQGFLQVRGAGKSVVEHGPHLLVTGLRQFPKCFFQLGLVLQQEAIFLPQLLLQQRHTFQMSGKAKDTQQFTFCDAISI